MRRGLRACGWAPKRTGQLAIVGSGPSVSEYLDELKAWPGEIWAINGAYRFLLDEGVHVHAFVGLDPVPGLREYVTVRGKHVSYLLSSVCDPCVFDELAGEDVWLWHSKGYEYPPGSHPVGGGTTCLTRAPYLAHMVGWRDITVYGADSSFSARPYCYEQRFAEDIGSPVAVEQHPRFVVDTVDGKSFETNLALAKQVSVFGVMQQHFNGMLKFRCGGLLAAFLDAPMCEIVDGSLVKAA